MDATDAYSIPNIVSGLALLLLYGWTFWRVWRRNPGNKLMECACIAGLIFLGMFGTMKVPGVPIWVPALLGLLGVVVGFAMTFFIFKGAFLAVRAKFQPKQRSTSI